MFKQNKMSMILIALIVLTFLIAGCGANPKSSANDGNSAQPSSTNEAGQKPAAKVELTVSAAASLTDALQEIKKDFEAKNPSITLNYNFGASGTLQQQIEQGAPADLFLSAAAKNMKALVDDKLIDANQQKSLLTNDLVAVIPSDAKTAIGSVTDLTKAEVKKVAVGIPESVPAGNYAKEALNNAKLWESLQPKMVQAKDVRQVLNYVETGNADAGFVYKTDAMTSQKVKVAFAVDPKTYTPVQYPIGIVKATKHAKEAEACFAYLQSKEALDVFIKYGFSISK